ncbi:MAG: LPS export ABC transporter periplasmic protein LptC [Gammaproteobacteria bacterium]|nr:LPS export ABC transporter periplasmic protein LptC [Gammaproteobacteria bacterium]
MATWWLTGDTPSDVRQPRPVGSFPNSYAEQLTVTSYNHDGIPHSRLQTPRMRYYEATDTTLLDKPILWRYSPDHAPWLIQGETAQITQAGEKISLPGPVTIDRAGLGASPPYHIETRDLHMVAATNYAETDQAIRVESEDHWITAIGMQGWLQEPVRIKLLNQVRGHYDRQ